MTSRHNIRRTISYSRRVKSSVQRTLTACLVFYKETELRMETAVKQESKQHGMLGLKSLSERIQKVTLKGVAGNLRVSSFDSQINRAVQLKKENAWNLPVRPDGYQSLPESHFPYTFLGMFNLVGNIHVHILSGRSHSQRKGAHICTCQLDSRRGFDARHRGQRSRTHAVLGQSRKTEGRRASCYERQVLLRVHWRSIAR